MDLGKIATPEPAALKALSHPVRLRILGMLRLDGPATATSLAERLQLNSGATSYHLRQLAQHGFVEDDTERGNKRERWWRAAHSSTTTRGARGATAEQREASDAFGQAVAVVHSENLQRAMEERPLLPEEWRAASTLSEWELRLTPQHAEQLKNAISELVMGWPEDEPAPGVELFAVTLHAFPYPGRVVPEDPS
jgi:DNA-binding transcriptional ArsR family regulator